MLVDHPHKINFYKTTIVRVSTKFVMLADHPHKVDPFRFVTFSDLLSSNVDLRVAFDFISQVVSTDPMRVLIENSEEKKLINLTAQDISGRKIVVCLWDNFASKLSTYIAEHQNETEPMVILLRKPQVGKCLFGSRLHINEDIPKIVDFKDSLGSVDVNVSSSTQNSQFSTATIVANPEDYYLRFAIKNIDDIPEYQEE